MSMYGHLDCVKCLLRAKPDTSGADTCGGNNAVMLACKPCCQEWISASEAATAATRLEVVTELLEHGQFELERKDEQGATALLLAVENGYTDIVQLLLSKGADVNTEDYQGTQCLNIAACSGFTEIVKVLLQHGASVQHRNEKGATALWHALQLNTKANAEIVELLLKAGSDPNTAVSSSMCCYRNASARAVKIVCAVFAGRTISLPLPLMCSTVAITTTANSAITATVAIAVG
jgi:ankyrin repeat protein